MGISAPSLYNAFDDKHTLFCSTLDRYCRTRTYPLIERLAEVHRGAAAVPAFFAEIVERSVADRQRRGCFLINSALEIAPHDAVVAKAVGAHLAAIRGFIETGLSALARSNGKRTRRMIAHDADHLMAVLLGIRILARMRRERELLADTARAALRSVGYAPAQLRAFGTGRVRRTQTSRLACSEQQRETHG